MACIISKAKAWVDFNPLGEVILASKLSTIACTKPISDDWIPVSCVSLVDTTTDADALNLNTPHHMSNRYQDHENAVQTFLAKGYQVQLEVVLADL